jgi:integrase
MTPSEGGGPSDPVAEFTVQEFIDTYWKRYHQLQNTKPGTMYGYLSVLNHHVSEAFKRMRMVEVTPTHIMAIVQENEEAGLKPNTIRNIPSVVGGIFTLAVELELVQRSPVRRAHFPDKPKPKKNRVVWTPQQILRIIMATPREFKAIFALLAFCATRINEVLALQWRHVDLEKDRVLIEQSLFKGQIVSTKTNDQGESYMPPGLVGVACLRSHYDSREHHRQSNDFVFCKRDGRPLDDDVLRLHVLYPILDRLGIPRVPYESGFHCFRHTAGSLVNAETGNLKLVQGLLMRHAQLSTTADTYVHNLPESDREVAKILERKIFGSCSQLFPVFPNFGDERVQ